MKRKQKAKQAQIRATEAKCLAEQKQAAEAARQLQLETERAAERAPILAAAELRFVELVTQYNDCVNIGRVDLACGRLNTAKAMAVEAREWRNAARNLVRESGLNATRFNCSREPVAELEKAIENKIAQLDADKAARAAAQMEKLRQEAIARETKRYEEQQKLRAESLRREAVTRLGRELDRRWTMRFDTRHLCALCVKGIGDEAHREKCFELVDAIDRLEAFLEAEAQRFGRLQLGLDCGHRNWADVIKPVFHEKKGHEIEALIAEVDRREQKDRDAKQKFGAGNKADAA